MKIEGNIPPVEPVLPVHNEKRPQQEFTQNKKNKEQDVESKKKEDFDSRLEKARKNLEEEGGEGWVG